MSNQLTPAYLKKALEVCKDYSKGLVSCELALEEYEVNVPLYVAEIRALRRQVRALESKVDALRRKGGVAA